jgi:hypothetical protein
LIEPPRANPINVPIPVPTSRITSRQRVVTPPADSSCPLPLTDCVSIRKPTPRTQQMSWLYSRSQNPGIRGY